MLPSSLPHPIILPSGVSASAYIPPPSPFHGSPITSPVSQLYLHMVPSSEPLTMWTSSCKKTKARIASLCPSNLCFRIGPWDCAGVEASSRFGFGEHLEVIACHCNLVDQCNSVAGGGQLCGANELTDTCWLLC